MNHNLLNNKIKINDPTTKYNKKINTIVQNMKNLFSMRKKDENRIQQHDMWITLLQY